MTWRMCLSIIFASSDAYGIVFVEAGLIKCGRFGFENIYASYGGLMCQ